MVAPFAGAWIEICTKPTNFHTSHCRFLRGSVVEMMKNNFEFGLFMVAPFVGVRIEISGTEVTEMSCSVAPFMGA